MSSTKLTLLVGNDSVRLIHDEPPSPNVPCGFLLSILAGSLLLNAFVLLAVMLSSLRSSLYNCLLAYLSGVSVFESLANVTSSVIIHASWEDLYRSYGGDFVKIFCRFNTSTMMMTTILQSYILAAMSLDRSTLLNSNNSQNLENEILEKKLKPLRRVGRATPFTAAIAGVLILPTACGIFITRFIDQRFSCSPTYVSLETTNILIAVATIIIGYCLPWLFIIKFWITIAKKVLNERKRLRNLELVARQRAAERRSPLRGMGSSLGFSYAAPWNQLWGPVNYFTGEGFPLYVLTGLLIISFALMVIPNVVSVQITQFYTQYQVIEEKGTFLMMTINKTELPIDLVPIETNFSDKIFMWTRYVYVVLSPFLILIFQKEIRKQVQAMLCSCFNKNSIRQSQPRSVSAYVKELKDKDFRKKHEYKKKREKFKKTSDFHTPVLFATSSGLHLRIVENGFQNSKNSFWPAEPKFVLEFCDLVVNVPRGSPPKKKVIPKLSQTPPTVKKDVRVEDEVANKKGKCVRFAQGVSEIPLTESGIYSSDDQAVGTDWNFVKIKPYESYGDLKPLPNRVSFDRLQEKRYSDTFIKFPNVSDVSKNLSRDRNKSLELDLIQNGKLNESSSSLLLSLSQRMRNRNS